MKRLNKPGFTIIETMLFLAISGILMVSVLVGTGASINIQRYRDSVTSLQSTLQNQFSEVASVSNSRDSNWSCDSSTGVITKIESGSGENRGQTDCVVLGRIILPSSDGRKVYIRDVVGSKLTESELVDNDIDALKNYKISISPVISIEHNIQWNASMAKPNSNSSSEFSILILNSPLSGITRTFIDPNRIIDDDEINELINENNLTNPLKICINSNGLFTGTRMAVFVRENVTGASGIETLGDDSGC